MDKLPTSFKPFIHPKALVDPGVSLGSRTRIWAFAHIVTGAIIGDDCNICDHTFVEGKVCVGNRVTIKCGVYLWDGIRVEDDVFIGPAVVFTNDLRPRSKQYPAKYPTTILKKGCSLGANSTILPDLIIGRWAMIGAGSIVTRDVPDFALIFGSPATVRGWVCHCGQKLGSFVCGTVTCSCRRSYKTTRNKTIKEL